MRHTYSFIALAMVTAGCATSSVGPSGSELTPATSSSTDATSAILCRAESPRLSFTLRLVDCENHWVALPKRRGDDAYGYGYVYLDPERGFTLHMGGRFTLDAQEQYHKLSDFLAEGRMMRIRLGGQPTLPTVAALSKPALTQLGLPEQPEWVKLYEDKSDQITRKIRRGRAYNAIGDPERALAYLEPTYREKPQAPGLAFELAYAYNALNRFDSAIAVLTTMTGRNPKDPYLCRELAFSYLMTKKFKEAVVQYPSCIALSTGGQLELKADMAFNLARAYSELGDKENCEQWLAKAEEWAPQGSRMYDLFKQERASIRPCAL
jgi:tetratricopeptide (TPR) repeat protein